MNYKIKAIFSTEKDAKAASPLLQQAGYVTKFFGYTQNAHIHPESLIEDHQVEKNHVTVFTPNLNRAFKAKNILAKIGAISTKMKQPFSRIPTKEEKTTVYKNLIDDLQTNLLNFSQTIPFDDSSNKSSLKFKKISDLKNIMLNNR